MQIADILRKAADLVDAAEQGQMPQGAEAQPEQGGEVADVTVTHLEPVEVQPGEEADSESMVSPLQQEHELLKKSQGVENNVSEFAGEEGDECEMGDSSAEEQEWEMAMGYDQDDPEERIGEPDDEVEESGEKDWYERQDKVEEEEEVEEDADFQSELNAMRKIAGIGEQQQGPVDHAESIRPVSLNPRAEAAKEFHRSRRR